MWTWTCHCRCICNIDYYNTHRSISMLTWDDLELGLCAHPAVWLLHEDLRYTLFTGDCPVQPEQLQTLAPKSEKAETIVAEAGHQRQLANVFLEYLFFDTITIHLNIYISYILYYYQYQYYYDWYQVPASLTCYHFHDWCFPMRLWLLIHWFMKALRAGPLNSMSTEASSLRLRSVYIVSIAMLWCCPCRCCVNLVWPLQGQGFFATAPAFGGIWCWPSEYMEWVW